MTDERLPNAERAIVSERKITAYLLSELHPDGWGKARFFRSFGFSAGMWQELADALRSHAAKGFVSRRELSTFGVRYAVEGPMPAPDGRTPYVRSVWFVERGEDIPRFVTAYPAERRSP